MRIKIVASVLLSFIAAGTAIAAPTVIDRHDYIEIISRPNEHWSPDYSSTDNELDYFQDKAVGYTLYNAEGKMRYVYSDDNDDPVALRVAGLFKPYKVDYVRYTTKWLSFKEPLVMTPDEYKDLVNNQKQYHQQAICSAGDPESARAKYLASKTTGIFASIALFAASAVHLGAPVAQGIMVGGNGAQDTTNFFTRFGDGVILDSLPDVDLSSYASVEAYPVVTIDQSRRVLSFIAYKNTPTAETKMDAKAHLIVDTYGFDRTLDQIKAALDADYKDRVDTWPSCQKSKT